jgi:hypothetical protein
MLKVDATTMESESHVRKIKGLAVVGARRQESVKRREERLLSWSILIYWILALTSHYRFIVARIEVCRYRIL